jgi:hypothetical protein
VSTAPPNITVMNNDRNAYAQIQRRRVEMLGRDFGLTADV